MRSIKGFSLIEVIVALGILTVLSFAGFVGLSKYKGGKDVELTLKELTAVIRDTQKNSITEKDGKTWGISFLNSTSAAHTYEVWSGPNYASGSVTRAYPLSRNVFFSNPTDGFKTDALFSALAGKPGETRTISLVNRKKDGLVGDIIIFSRGTVTTRIENGLRGYWHFDEATGTEIYDSSGFGNNGIFTSNPVWQNFLNCRAGACLGFDTSSFQNISITNSFGLNPKTKLSLMAWIYPLGSGGSDALSTVIWGATPAAYYLSFDDSIRALSCYWYDTNPPGYHTTGAESVPLNQWSHIACVWDGASLRQYINGVLVNTVAVSLAGRAPTAVVIGAETAARQFQGYIDEVRIYGRDLGATEILNHFNDFK